MENFSKVPKTQFVIIIKFDQVFGTNKDIT